MTTAHLVFHSASTEKADVALANFRAEHPDYLEKKVFGIVFRDPNDTDLAVEDGDRYFSFFDPEAAIAFLTFIKRHSRYGVTQASDEAICEYVSEQTKLLQAMIAGQ